MPVTATCRLCTTDGNFLEDSLCAYGEVQLEDGCELHCLLCTNPWQAKQPLLLPAWQYGQGLSCMQWLSSQSLTAALSSEQQCRCSIPE